MNNELKAQYFAQYYGQYVFRHPTIKNGGSIQFKGRALEKGWLELKPLSAISDGDAIEVAKIIYGSSYTESGLSKVMQSAITDKLLTDLDNTHLKYSDSIKLNDFLRSKGYALSFRELSVERLTELGWLKLGETIKTN